MKAKHKTNTAGLLGFPAMTKLVKPGEVGTAKVFHSTVGPFESMRSAMKPGQFCPEGTYAVLHVDGGVMMSDTLMERKSNLDVVHKARGRVLIAGLGIGMILHPIADKTEVEHVTVIEKNPDVIDLIKPTLPTRKVDVVCADIFEWRSLSQKWETIYFDIWPDLNADNLPAMTKLHRQFRKHLALGGWMNSWSRDRVRALQRMGHL